MNLANVVLCIRRHEAAFDFIMVEIKMRDQDHDYLDVCVIEYNIYGQYCPSLQLQPSFPYANIADPHFHCTIFNTLWLNHENIFEIGVIRHKAPDQEA